jgi:hypothetical protein
MFGQLMVYLFTCFEYLSMLYIIKTEDNRKVEEIKWDHEAENMEESLKFIPLAKDLFQKMKKSDGTKYSES